MTSTNNDLKDGFPTLGKLEDAKPSGDWTLEQLGQYARHHEQTAKRKMAIHTYRQGHALTIAFEKVETELGYGHWGKYLEQHGISKSSDDRARKLFAVVENEEALEGLQITEAYEAFGIEKPKAAKATTATTATKAGTASRKSAAKVDMDTGQEGHHEDQGPEENDPAEPAEPGDGSGTGHDDDSNDADMLRAALKTVQELSEGDHWNVLGRMIAILGLEWSEVAAWAAQQANSAPAAAPAIAGEIEDAESAVLPALLLGGEAVVTVSAPERSAPTTANEQVSDAEIVAPAEIVVGPAPALLLGGEADVLQAAGAHHEDGIGDDMDHKPSKADPARVTVGGKTHDVAWASGMWFFRGGNDWISCSKDFVQAIEEQLAAASTKQAA